MAAAKTKRKELSLGEKIELIKASNEQSLSQRDLGTKFGISKTQVQGILKRKAEIMGAYGSNCNLAAKRMCYHNSQSDIDELTWRWFQGVRSKNTPVSGPLIQEQARIYAEQLHKDDFKASNGWLSRFKIRHNISSAILSGERASVDLATVDSWRSRLPEITKDYALKDIYNMDETGLFFRALPEKSLAVKGSDCAGSKKSKDRVTVSLCVNALGEFEQPLVIGHALKPRCFKNITPQNLPVVWTANKKAWMTTTIFTDWVKKFDSKMAAQGRHILLLLENAPAHPQELELSNVVLQYLPANTTSMLQPLDLGIIKNFKCHYRTRQLRTILSKIENASSAAEIAKSINVLDACHWIKAAMDDIKPVTVENCFHKAGIKHELEADIEVTSPDEMIPLNDLIPRVCESLDIPPLTSDNVLELDNEIPTTEELLDGWEQEILEDYIAEKAGTNGNESDDESTEAEVVKPAITTVSEAMRWTYELKQFAAERGLEGVFANMISAEELQKAAINTHQTKIKDFFKPTN